MFHRLQSLKSCASVKQFASTAKTPVAEAEETGPIDETGMSAKDIEMIMSQTNVSRAKAVKVLKENQNDLVSAIMVFVLFLFSSRCLNIPSLTGALVVSRMVLHVGY